jgi:hypothetical protein
MSHECFANLGEAEGFLHNLNQGFSEDESKMERLYLLEVM